MSADNWAECPKCKGISIQKSEDLFCKASDSYGKIPSNEYLDLLELAQKFEREPEGQHNLREDYEIWINDGMIYVNYTGSCKVCKFKFQFKHTEKVLSL